MIVEHRRGALIQHKDIILFAAVFAVDLPPVTILPSSLINSILDMHINDDFMNHITYREACQWNSDFFNKSALCQFHCLITGVLLLVSRPHPPYMGCFDEESDDEDADYTTQIA